MTRTRPDRLAARQVLNWRRLLALVYNLGAWTAIIALALWAPPLHL